MAETNKTIIVKTTVNAPVEKVWDIWSQPEHITQWNHASEDWHAPYAENDLREGGKFKTTMAAKDGSFGFDFEGVYTAVKKYQLIEYKIADGRKVSISFVSENHQTQLTETFEAEDINSVELQQGGWQAILDNFKKYVEKSI